MHTSGSQPHLPIGEAEEDSFEVFVAHSQLGQCDSAVESKPIQLRWSVNRTGHVYHSLIDCQRVAGSFEHRESSRMAVVDRAGLPEPSATEIVNPAKLAPEALALLIDGVDLRGPRMKPWYQRSE